MFEVTEYSVFGTLLGRMADHRGLALCELSDSLESELESVLCGKVPGVSLLKQLASVLELHAADLFVIAQVAPPDEWASLDSVAGRSIPHLVKAALQLSPAQKVHLRQYVRTLPESGSIKSTEDLRVYEQYDPGAGAVLMGLLANRNLNWSSTAKVLSLLGGVHLAASTIGALGHGREDMTPDLLPAFALVLGMRIDDLAAFFTVEPSDSGAVSTLATADIADLIWDVRGLTHDQVQQVVSKAESLVGAEE